MPAKRILICSTPVGALGSGVGGGVELTLHTLVVGLSALGHHVEVVAPEGSLQDGTTVHQVGGGLQTSSQTEDRDAPITMPASPVLGAMWEWARNEQHRFDVIINLAYDWLPLYLSPFFERPVAHLVSMGSLNDAMDSAIVRSAMRHPGSVAVHSRAQAQTFSAVADDLRIVGSGVEVDRYRVRERADQPPWLAVVGRISPEKGIDDVFAISARSGVPVRAWGLMQDRAGWDDASDRHPDAAVRYEGFLATDELQEAIGGAVALLMTPKWIEAFGNVAIEAMACGVPVIAYRRGGPSEIVVDGETGFLVEPDDVDAAASAVGRVEEIDRAACRRRVEQHYSTAAFAGRVDDWLSDLVRATASRHQFVAEEW